MPLPQLNTQGIDITNTLMRMRQMDNARAQEEDRRVAAGQRNSLFELQKRKADYEMSPENLKTQNALQQADMEYKKAVTSKANTEAMAVAADQMALTMKGIPLTPGLTEYAAFRKQILAHPLLAKAGAVLPDENDWLKPDERSPTGFSIPEGDIETFKKVFTNLANTAAERKQRVTQPSMTKIQVPRSDGSMRDVVVGIPQDPGVVFDLEKEIAPGARLYNESAGKDKSPEVKTFTEGGNEIQKQYNSETKKWENIPGVTGGPKFKPESEKDKEATVKENFINKNGVHITQFNDGSKWKSISGKLVPITNADDVGLQRIGDVMNPLMQKALGGMVGEEGENEGTGSSLIDTAKAWIGKKVEDSEKASTPPVKASTSADGVVTKPVTTAMITEIKSKEERDALPPGAVYTYNGVKYRKK